MDEFFCVYYGWGGEGCDGGGWEGGESGVNKSDDFSVRERCGVYDGGGIVRVVVEFGF